MKQVICRQQMTTEQQAAMVGYLTHGLCLAGEAQVRLNGQDMTLHKNDSFILRRSELGEVLSQTDDFNIVIIYVLSEFIELATPLSNYGMRGGMMLFGQPIMPLTDEQAARLKASMDYITSCVYTINHLFYRDLLLNAVQRMILDFFDFHASLYGNTELTQPAAMLMNGFLELLEQGVFREERSIGYYADQLNVTSKYLSETVKQYSDYSASHWINRYTALDLSRMLRRGDLTLTELADMYHFSSVSHLNRYIKSNLGLTPNEIRK